MHALLIASLMFFANFEEEQVSFDSKGRVMEITKEDAKQWNLFKDVKGFERAYVYRTSPTAYRIEIYREEKGKTYREMRKLSKSEFNSFRSTIDSLLLAHPKLDRSGWGLYLLGQLQVAFSEWGILTCRLLPKNTAGETYAATYLLTAGGGFFVPLYLTLNSPITFSQASLSWSWAHQGYYAGFFLKDITDWSGTGNIWNRDYAASEFAGGILGSWTGYSFAGKYNLSVGKADLMAWFGYWGCGYAGTIAGLLVPWEGEDDEWKWKTCRISALLGMVYGNYFWYSRGKDIYTYGDALAYRTFSILSGLTSMNIVSYFPWDGASEWEAKAYTLTGLAINAVGMWKGLSLFEPVDLGFVDGIAMGGGAIAGSVVGLGVAFLTKPSDWKPWFSFTLAGGWGGYFLTYNLISQGKGASKSMGFQFYPENLATLWISKVQNRPLSTPLITFAF